MIPVRRRHREGEPSRGFTLVEMLVVVALIGILTAIALPGYAEYVRRAHRAEARTALVQAALWMERAATATGSYPTALPTALSRVPTHGYSIQLTAADAGSFTLAAVPKRGSPVDNDRCGTFTLDQASQRGLVLGDGIEMAHGLLMDCWQY